MGKKSEGAVVAAEPQGAGSLMVLINRAAVDPAFDVAKLDALLKVKMEWEKDEARKAFVVALNQFKANPPTLTKNKAVHFETSKGNTDYRHATLDQVSAVIGKALSAVGISHRWDVEQREGSIYVGCILTHERGHSEKVQIVGAADTSGSKNSIQAIGSTITYLQRYTLLAATGLAVQGQDDDGNRSESMAESVRIDFESAIDSAADPDALEMIWKSAVTECKKTPKDMATYNSLKALVTAKGKALKKKAKGGGE